MTSLDSALLGGSIIDLDGTIFVQLAIFFLAFFALRYLVFEPMLSLFKAREDAIDGARHAARKMEKDADAKAKAFEEAMNKVRLEAAHERDRLRAEGQRLERTMLEKVRKDTAADLDRALEKLEHEARAMRDDLAARTPALAREIAARLLGREVS